jgi:hypothetical protein
LHKARVTAFDAEAEPLVQGQRRGIIHQTMQLQATKAGPPLRGRVDQAQQARADAAPSEAFVNAEGNPSDVVLPPL